MKILIACEESQAICKGEEGYISKWRNLGDDIEKIDGVIIPDPDFREGNAKIYILGEKVRPREDLTQYGEHISDPESHENEKQEYDFSDSKERMRWLNDIGELGECIGEGSSRYCFENLKNPNLVIKIPIPGKEDDADWKWEDTPEGRVFFKKAGVFKK